MFQKIPFELQNKINSELKFDERVVWADQPNPNTMMKSGFALWLFFIPWTAFALFWTAGASGFKIPDFSKAVSLFPLFGLPFILIGLGGLSSPFWLRRLASKTVYVITNKRLLTISGVRQVKYVSYYPNQIKFIERKENKDGSGDLIFARTGYKDSDGDRRTKDDGFFAVQNVKTVETYIEDLLETTKKQIKAENNSSEYIANSIYENQYS